MSSLFELIKNNNTKNSLLEALKPKIRKITLENVSRETDLVESIHANFSMTLQALEQHGEFIDFQITVVKRNGTDYISEHRHLMFPNLGKFSKLSKINIRNVAILLNLLGTIKERYYLQHTSTVRDIFYSNVELYQKQTRVNYWLQIIASNFKLNNINKLNIVPAQKGLIFSSMLLHIDDSIILKPGLIHLIPYINENSKVTIQNDACNLVRQIHLKIFEKEAIFNKVIQNYCNNNQASLSDTIFVTGKGYPDMLTKVLIERLGHCLSKNILIRLYVDADPYGINIALSYIKNASNIKSIHYNGVSITQLIKRRGQILPMNYRDYIIAKSTIHRITKQLSLIDLSILDTPYPSLKSELQRQMFWGKKGEMNALYA